VVGYTAALRQADPGDAAFAPDEAAFAPDEAAFAPDEAAFAPDAEDTAELTLDLTPRPPRIGAVTAVEPGSEPTAGSARAGTVGTAVTLRPAAFGAGLIAGNGAPGGAQDGTTGGAEDGDAAAETEAAGAERAGSAGDRAGTAEDEVGGSAAGAVIDGPGGGGRRRLRAGVLVGAALALIVAAGIGAAAFLQGPPDREASPPVQVPTQPVDPDATFSTGAHPGIDPAHLADPTVVGTDAFGGPPITEQDTGESTIRTGGGGGADPDVPAGPVVRPTSPSWPITHEPTSPPEPSTPPAPEPPAPAPPSPVDPSPASSGGLDAALAHTDDAWTLGLGGYSATVTIDNPGASAVSGWRVSLTVPGGNQVRNVQGVTVAQDGARVVFTPKGAGTVPAGGSVSFTFAVKGLLAAEPTDCAIDGHPCR
jgi:hypothetical protein